MGFLDRAKEKAEELAKQAKPMAEQAREKAKPMAEKVKDGSVKVAKSAKDKAEDLRNKQRGGDGPSGTGGTPT